MTTWPADDEAWAWARTTLGEDLWRLSTPPPAPEIPAAFRRPVRLIPAREAIPPMLDADRLGDGIVPACTTLGGPA